MSTNFEDSNQIIILELFPVEAMVVRALLDRVTGNVDSTYRGVSQGVLRLLIDAGVEYDDETPFFEQGDIKANTLASRGRK